MMVGVLIAGAVIVLLVWIIPLRRRGIRGIRLRGPKLSAILSASVAEDESERKRRRQRGNVPPQVAREPAGRDEPDDGDGHVLAELEKNWEPGYVERVEAFFRSRKH